MEHGRTAHPAGAHRGQRIRLVSRETLPGHPPCDLQPGDEGQVTLVDSLGTVHVRWDRGGEFGLIPGHDFWTVAGDRSQGNDGSRWRPPRLARWPGFSTNSAGSAPRRPGCCAAVSRSALTWGFVADGALGWGCGEAGG